MRHCLGRPLSHQQADTPRADPGPKKLCLLHHAVLQGYPVLATVSRCYPRVQGTLPTCYSPVRRFQGEGLPLLLSSLDLHVLSTPPAFVLSQDQTLRRDLSSSNRWPTEVVHLEDQRLFDADQRTLTIESHERLPNLFVVLDRRNSHSDEGPLVSVRTSPCERRVLSAGTLFSSQRASFSALRGKQKRRSKKRTGESPSILVFLDQVPYRRLLLSRVTWSWQEGRDPWRSNVLAPRACVI